MSDTNKTVCENGGYERGARKKPKYYEFREALAKKGLNLTAVGRVFGVTRGTVYRWIKSDPLFAEAYYDERGRLVDDCIVSARVLALGIAERDADGKFIGWQDRPDGNMLRFLLQTYGRKEGFGTPEEDSYSEPRRTQIGVSVDKWLERESEINAANGVTATEEEEKDTDE